MKKIVFLFLLVFCSLSVFTQTNDFQPEWAFGVNGGTTFSQVRFTPKVPQESLMQYSGGITARYVSENHFGIQVELNYSQRGWKDLTDEVYLNKYERSLTYLELPLMTHLYFNMGKRARLVFNLGPQIAWNLNESTSLEENGSDWMEYYNLSVQRKFDYGIKGCAGIEIRTGVGSFILDGRYYFGLSDVFNNTKKDPFASSANQVIGVNLTYLIQKKQ